MKDIIFIFLLNVVLLWENYAFSKKQGLDKGERFGLFFFWFYHLAFSFLFHHYIMNYGGDAVRYWNLTADTSQKASTWMGHWGQRTFFVQWLNYLPAKLLGLHLLSGHLIYAAVSFYAFRVLYFNLIKPVFVGMDSVKKLLILAVLMFPNIHFWTAGVGKESLLFLGLCLGLIGFVDLKKYYILVIFGIWLSFWVRPIQGVVLGFLVWVNFMFNATFSLKQKLVVSMPISLAAIWAVQMLYAYLHVDAPSFGNLMGFFSEQRNFLKDMSADSEVPMEEYGFYWQFLTVYFRPHLFEIQGLWSGFSAVENSLSFILFVALALSWTFHLRKLLSINKFGALEAGFIIFLVMGIIYSQTLNNLGIMMRMKSIYMLFMYLLALKTFYIYKSAYSNNKLFL